MKRIRPDHPDYEMCGAQVRKARSQYPCDDLRCHAEGVYIIRGAPYAYISTGIKLCSLHFQPSDVVEVTK